MQGNHWGRRTFLQALAASGASCLAGGLSAQDGLKEPVYRVSKANDVPAVPMAERHPLDPALDMARDAVTLIQRDIVDYTATIVKRERIKGVLGEYEFMQAKIRNRKVVDGKLDKPLSVYLKFVKPADIAGREVVWVEGQNNNKLRAHEGGLKGKLLPTVWLDPDSALAMRGQLHPIYDVGIENLVTKLIERGEREKKYGECEVTFTPGAKINGRLCTVLRVIHPTQRPHFEFHKAEIFIDDQMKIPLRYAAFYWPVKTGEELPVLEEYTYLDVKLGLVGSPLLQDADFNSENPSYNF
ncbi:MAG TPA: DUF1571 domain-containing protein [Pirellulaceae bacterium]|nr:DUF1571 domain-containing protein [Pirellulaceae bacterium]